MVPLLTLLTFLACTKDGPTSTVAASGPAPASVAAPAYGPGADAVVAYWNGGDVKYGAVKDSLKQKISKMEADYLNGRYEAESQDVDDKVNEAILTAEAKATGVTGTDALLKREIEEKVTDPNEQEVAEAYQILQRKFRGKPLEEVRPEVIKAVRQKKQAELFDAYMVGLRTKYGVVVQLPYPDLPRMPVSADDDPFIGPETALITIVQFADYQCPYCGKAQESIDQVMTNYEGKVKFVFRDFPLSFHDEATPAAAAANCAGKQDKFWPYHGAIMKNQKALSEADLQKLAAENGLDIAKWDECRKDPAIVAEIEKDEADGAQAGVTGTPAFFINGIFLNGAQPYEKFKAIIDRELAAKPG